MRENGRGIFCRLDPLCSISACMTSSNLQPSSLNLRHRDFKFSFDILALWHVPVIAFKFWSCQLLALSESSTTRRTVHEKDNSDISTPFFTAHTYHDQPSIRWSIFRMFFCISRVVKSPWADSEMESTRIDLKGQVTASLVLERAEYLLPQINHKISTNHVLKDGASQCAILSTTPRCSGTLINVRLFLQNSMRFKKTHFFPKQSPICPARLGLCKVKAISYDVR